MHRKILSFLRKHFGFSRTESNGFVLLLFLMVLAIATPFITKTYLLKNQEPSIAATDTVLLNQLISKLEGQVKPNANETILESNPLKKITPFNLNKVEAIQLQQTQIPSYIAERIVKYRQQVKLFDSVDELFKIYGLDSSMYQKIKPYAFVESVIQPKKINPLPKQIVKNIPIKGTELKPFDINDADTAQLKKVFGIGPTYAKRIVAYRNLLGGYISLNQLKNVYGLKEENLDSLLKYIFIENTFTPQQININVADLELLSSHPYISKQEAKIIIAYRSNHGDYKSVTELKALHGLKKGWYQQVEKYLVAE